MLDVTKLKKFAAERLGTHSALREVLLQEKDHILPSDFVAKTQVWLVLLRFEGAHNDEGRRAVT